MRIDLVVNIYIYSLPSVLCDHAAFAFIQSITERNPFASGAYGSTKTFLGKVMYRAVIPEPSLLSSNIIEETVTVWIFVRAWLFLISGSASVHPLQDTDNLSNYFGSCTGLNSSNWNACFFFAFPSTLHLFTLLCSQLFQQELFRFFLLPIKSKAR